MDEKKLNLKYELFKKDFNDKKNFSSGLEKIFQYIFCNIFPNILNLPKIDFLNMLSTTVKAILEEKYSSEIFSNENFFSLLLSMNKKYEKKYVEYSQALSLSWDNFQNELYTMKKEEDINIYKITAFNKHCSKTQEYAMHKCNKKERGKYIIAGEKKFVICDNCRKSYYSNLFINYCQNCDCNYYCGLAQKKDENLPLASFFSPHCEPIANDKIFCVKCKGALCFNIKDNLLQCSNSSCKYKVRPYAVNWKCNICSNYFKSEIKLFNNLELYYIKKIVCFALLIKSPAYPGIIPCCENVDGNNLIFTHKKDCKGALFFWFLHQKIIVICEKCKAINYFNRFIWTCPRCGLHFRTKKEDMEEKIKKNILKNFKNNLNLKILLGDEYSLNKDVQPAGGNYFFKGGNKIKKKKSFQEVLNSRKNDLLNNSGKNYYCTFNNNGFDNTALESKIQSVKTIQYDDNDDYTPTTTSSKNKE